MPSTKSRFTLTLGRATREAYGDALLELGRANRDIVAIESPAGAPSDGGVVVHVVAPRGQSHEVRHGGPGGAHIIDQ